VKTVYLTTTNQQQTFTRWKMMSWMTPDAEFLTSPTNVTSDSEQ